MYKNYNFKVLYVVFNVIFVILEVRFKVCQYDELYDRKFCYLCKR